MKGRKGPSAPALDETNSHQGNKRKQPFYPVSQISKSSKLRFDCETSLSISVCALVTTRSAPLSRSDSREFPDLSSLSQKVLQNKGEVTDSQVLTNLNLISKFQNKPRKFIYLFMTLQKFRKS